MLPTENYQKLRERIIEAVPSIMELKFGCEVRFNAYNEEFIYLRKSLKGHEIIKKGGEKISIVSICDIEIIGRPMELRDVLRASLRSKSAILTHLLSGDELMIEQEETGKSGDWDLTKDLEGQSDEVKTFLYELLK